MTCPNIVYYILLACYTVRPMTPMTAKALHSSTSDFSSVGRAFDTLLAYDDHWNDLVHDESALLQLHEFIYYYASECVGRNTIKEWLRANQDKSLLDKLTANDLAFTMLVYENYHPKWAHEIIVEREGNQGAEDGGAADTLFSVRQTQNAGQKRKRYAGPTLKYTTTHSKKNAYLGNGWTPEAFHRLRCLENLFDGLMSHDEAWTSSKKAWEAFVLNEKDLGGNNCWVPIFVRLSGDDEEYGGEEDDEAGNANAKGLFDFKLAGGSS